MPIISSVKGRLLYNSRGSKTIEVDIISDKQFLGRVCAPSGASVGKHEATSFPNEDPQECLKILNENSSKFVGLDSADLKSIHETIRTIDQTPNYSKFGGALAFAITIASIESAAKASNEPISSVRIKTGRYIYS